MKKIWTKAAALDALRREARRIGKTPSAKDLAKAHRVAPTCKVYQRLFGSIMAAQIAAGLPLNGRGGRKGWRKPVCHRGHRRTPDNLSSQGHCLRCAQDWKTPRRPSGLGRYIVLVPLDPQTAQQVTEAKKAHWGSAASPAWRHPYARRSA